MVVAENTPFAEFVRSSWILLLQVELLLKKTKRKSRDRGYLQHSDSGRWRGGGGGQGK